MLLLRRDSKRLTARRDHADAVRAGDQLRDVRRRSDQVL